jgi:hypothetical protein
MKTHGELTAAIGKNLKFDGCDVFYDHGVSGENVGKIVSTFSKDYGRDNELSQLDIAIVEKQSNNVMVLVEIEETSDRPKTFLSDIFGVLFGEHIFFKRKELKVGDFTTFIVVGVSKTDHEERNQYIQKQVSGVKANLRTQNAKTGNVMIKTYTDEREMIVLLPSVLDRAFKGEL